MRLLLLNGPNLNLLGEREPAIYGGATLPSIEAELRAAAASQDVDLRCVQSNHEGALVDALQEARRDCEGVILNPGPTGIPASRCGTPCSPLVFRRSRFT